RHLDSLDAAVDALGTGNVKALNGIAIAYGAQVGNTPQATYKAIAQIAKGDILSASSAVGAKNEQEEKAIDDVINPSNPGPALHASIKAARGLMTTRLATKGETFQNAANPGGAATFTPPSAPQSGGLQVGQVVKV